MTAFGWLLLALGVVTLAWALHERRFHQRVTLAQLSRGAVAGAPPPLTWEQRRAMVRRYEILNWFVALSVAAIFVGIGWVGLSYHAEIQALARTGTPPEVTVPSKEVPGPAEGAFLRWDARYLGGILTATVVDGGYVLFRAERAGGDQYYLYSPQGRLLWEGERGISAPAPPAALRSAQGLAHLAVQLSEGGARVLVFGPDGELAEESFTVPVFASEDEGYRQVQAVVGRSASWTSPDGKWQVDLTRTCTAGIWPHGWARLYGPRPGT